MSLINAVLLLFSIPIDELPFALIVPPPIISPLDSLYIPVVLLLFTLITKFESIIKLPLLTTPYLLFAFTFKLPVSNFNVPYCSLRIIFANVVVILPCIVSSTLLLYVPSESTVKSSRFKELSKSIPSK